MTKAVLPKIALVGNPNSGKSSLFNHLTGLKQKVGNFPGVTVDKKSGICQLDENHSAEIIDLPGTYSIYPNSSDEKIVFEILGDSTNQYYPDLVVVIADASNFKRNLLLFTQIHDLNIPTILVLNMMDVVEKTGLKINTQKLSELLNVPVVPMQARTGKGIDLLKSTIIDLSDHQDVKPIFDATKYAQQAIDEVKGIRNTTSDYAAYQLLQQFKINSSITATDNSRLMAVVENHKFTADELRRKETLERYASINKLIDASVVCLPS
ncbi:MAG: FeoB small GTPase domain-containing protein [Bacteroidota bacterium]